MIELLNGDCLELMKNIPAGSVDMVCTDPPYMINTKSTGAGKLNPWGDYCNAAYWYAEWMRQARRLLKPTGCLWSFLNWRSFVTFQKAACDIGWPLKACLCGTSVGLAPVEVKGYVRLTNWLHCGPCQSLSWRTADYTIFSDLSGQAKSHTVIRQKSQKRCWNGLFQSPQSEGTKYLTSLWGPEQQGLHAPEQGGILLV